MRNIIKKFSMPIIEIKYNILTCIKNTNNEHWLTVAGTGTFEAFHM